MNLNREIIIICIVGAALVAFLTTKNAGQVALAQQHAVQRWEYATLGRAPGASDLQFQSPESTVTSDTVEGLSQKLGGKPVRNWAVLMDAIGSQKILKGRKF